MLRTIGIGLGVLLLSACNGDDDTDNTEASQATGTIVAQTGETGDVAVKRAFGFATNGIGLVYMSSNPSATCDNVVEMLNADEAHNPDQVLLAGHCNFIYKFKYPESAGFDGLSFTEDDLLSTLWSVSCAMEDGAWEYSNNDGDRDYYYTGTWWQGSPDSHQTALNAVDEDIQITVTMGPYSGHFIYEGLDSIPATGQVSGTITAKRCTQLAQTDLFAF